MNLEKYYTGLEARKLCQDTVDEQAETLRKNLQGHAFEPTVFVSK